MGEVLPFPNRAKAGEQRQQEDRINTPEYKQRMFDSALADFGSIAALVIRSLTNTDRLVLHASAMERYQPWSDVYDQALLDIQRIAPDYVTTEAVAKKVFAIQEFREVLGKPTYGDRKSAARRWWDSWAGLWDLQME